jgi:hypothetical protein
MLFSTYPLADVSRIADPFSFAAGVVGPIIAKGLASIGRGIKDSSNSLILFFNLAFSSSRWIQGGLRITQNSQKFLRKLRMASAGGEKEKKFKVLKTQQNWHHREERVTRFPTT